MTTCNVCFHNEMAGALFCSICGAPIGESDPYETRSIRKTESDQLPKGVANDFIRHLDPPASADLPCIALRVVEHGEIIQKRKCSEVTLGRIADGQAQHPDVDLAPYGGYALGVSRQHAMISAMLEHFYLTDLGSINGTWLNGKRLEPQVPHQMQLGDIISLGKLKIQVIDMHGIVN